MRFSIEESELINSFFCDYKTVPSKETVIHELTNAKNNTQEPELIDIAGNTIKKICSLEYENFNKVFSELPINSFTPY